MEFFAIMRTKILNFLPLVPIGTELIFSYELGNFQSKNKVLKKYQIFRYYPLFRNCFSSSQVDFFCHVGPLKMFYYRKYWIS